jgi:ABC-2 type transport system ATP-binding protein
VSIAVEDYHKVYGATVAVAGLSFTVAPGEILGLVGPNGADKTTTLHALAGILTPTRGRLTIAGDDIASEPVAAKAALAYVPDEPKLFDQLTVWEHFRFVAGAYRLRADWTAAADMLLTQFELTEKRATLAAELSRGMRCGYHHGLQAIFFTRFDVARDAPP